VLKLREEKKTCINTGKEQDNETSKAMADEARLKFYSIELHTGKTYLKTVQAKLSQLTSFHPCLLCPLICRGRQRLDGHVRVY
jgi:hypothetical protein